MYHFLLLLHMSALKMTKVEWLAESMQNSNLSPENTSLFKNPTHSLWIHPHLSSVPTWNPGFLPRTQDSYLEPDL